MLTHFSYRSGLAPEIAMFVQWSDDRANEEDWYIKPNQYVFSPPYSTHLINKLLNLPATVSSSMGAIFFGQRLLSLSSSPTEPPVMRSIADGAGKYSRLSRSGVGSKKVVMQVLRMCNLCRPSSWTGWRRSGSEKL